MYNLHTQNPQKKKYLSKNTHTTHERIFLKINYDKFNGKIMKKNLYIFMLKYISNVY